MIPFSAVFIETLDFTAFLARIVKSTLETRWAEIVLAQITQAIVFQDAFTTIPWVIIVGATFVTVGAKITPNIDRASTTHLNVLLDAFVLL